MDYLRRERGRKVNQVSESVIHSGCAEQKLHCVSQEFAGDRLITVPIDRCDWYAAQRFL